MNSRRTAAWLAGYGTVLGAFATGAWRFVDPPTFGVHTSPAQLAQQVVNVSDATAYATPLAPGWFAAALFFGGPPGFDRDDYDGVSSANGAVSRGNVGGQLSIDIQAWREPGNHASQANSTVGNSSPMARCSTCSRPGLPTGISERS